MSEDNFICDYGARAIKESLEPNNITIAEWIRMPSLLDDQNMKSYLERMKYRGRSMFTFRGSVNTTTV